MKARDIIEAEDPKSVLRQASSVGYPFRPRRLTPRERERLANILAMGPLRKKPIDDRFLNWGYIEYYGDYEPGDPEFQQAVDAKPGFGEAFYSDPHIKGSVGPEWMDLPGEYKKFGRKFEAEDPKKVFRKAVSPVPRPKAQVTSSHGEFTIDNSDGRVMQWTPYEPDESGYGRIEKFDLDEWQKYWNWKGERPQGYDILDVGFWMKDGEYEPPDNQWREHVRWNIPVHAQPHQEEGLD